MDEEAVLAAATNPDGSRRFYPPYKHPATRQLREHLARLEEIDDGTSEDVAAAIEHDRSELAKFEHGEDRAKRDYLRAHRG